MPRANGGSPGRPTSRSGSMSAYRPAPSRSGSPWWSTAVGPPGPAGSPSEGASQSHGPYRPSIGRSPRVVNRSRRSGRRSRDGVSRSTRHARLRASQASERSLMAATLAFRNRRAPRAPGSRRCRRGRTRAARTPCSAWSAGQVTIVCPPPLLASTSSRAARLPVHGHVGRRQLLGVAVGGRALLVELQHLHRVEAGGLERGHREPGRAPEAQVAPAKRTPSIPSPASAPSAAVVQFRPESTLSGALPW